MVQILRQTEGPLQHQNTHFHNQAVVVVLACLVEAGLSFQVVVAHTRLYLCRSNQEVAGRLCSLLEARILLVEDRNRLSPIRMAHLVEAHKNLDLYLSSHMTLMSLLNLGASNLSQE